MFQDAGCLKALRNSERIRSWRTRETCIFMYLPHGKKNSRNIATIHVSLSNTQSNKVDIHFVSSSL